MGNAPHELESLESLKHIEVRFGLSSVIIFLWLGLTQVKNSPFIAEFKISSIDGRTRPVGPRRPSHLEGSSSHSVLVSETSFEDICVNEDLPHVRLNGYKIYTISALA